MNFSRSASNGDNFAIFGRLSPSASVKDLTLENITLNYSVRSGATVSLYLICNETEEGATFENFRIKNAKMNVNDARRAATVLNLTNANGGYFEDNWMFGNANGYSAGFDAQYLTAHTGITVEDCSYEIVDN